MLKKKWSISETVLVREMFYFVVDDDGVWCRRRSKCKKRFPFSEMVVLVRELLLCSRDDGINRWW